MRKIYSYSTVYDCAPGDRNMMLLQSAVAYVLALYAYVKQMINQLVVANMILVTLLTILKNCCSGSNSTNVPEQYKTRI